jgi:hypothetical protein
MFKLEILFLCAVVGILLPLLIAWGIASYRLRKEIRRRTAIEAVVAGVEQARDTAEAECADAERDRLALQERFKDILNVEAEVRRLDLVTFQQRDEIELLQKQYSQKREIFDRMAKEIAVFDERLAFAEMGVYEPHFDFDDSERYKGAIIAVREQQKKMMKEDTAAFCTMKWAVEGSVARGKVMMARNIRLTLRAFNNECDAAIANARWNNINAMEKRIERARDQIGKMNESLNIFISVPYFNLKMQELRLTHEYREKLKQEREERAEAARQAREEQKLLRDLEDAQQNEERYQTLLEKARKEAASAGAVQLSAFSEQIKLLERDLANAQAKLQRAQALAERTKSGYVYIISNVGSFGENIIKIGLTRRLDPTERVRELSDASVPFKFDTHAIIYSDDAPKLERDLHSQFNTARVNSRNLRKEFFRASLLEVESALKQLSPDATFIRDIDAQEYKETIALRQALLAQDNEPLAARLPKAI